MARAYLQHTMNRSDLMRSLASVAREEGIAKALARRLRTVTVEMPAERYLREMLSSMLRARRRIVAALGRNLDRWFEARFPSMRKAVAGVQLSREQVEELRALVEAHFQPVGLGVGASAGYEIPDEVWQRWQAEGIVMPGVQMPEIADAWVAGRLYQVLDDGASYATMRQAAQRHELSPLQQVASEWAQDHALEALRTYGQRAGNQAVRGALTQNQKFGRRLLADYLRDDLRLIRPPTGPVRDLTARTRRVLETEQVAKDWRALGRSLWKTFRGTDATRDWLRVAHTEVMLANQVGRVLQYQEQGVRYVSALVHPSACAPCKKLYLEADGVTPKVFPLSTILENLDATGGLNVGRKASRIGQPDGWIVTGGVVHPFDRCKLLPVVAHQKPITMTREKYQAPLVRR